MVTQHPYCRTCGSKIQSKKVCHHCGCEPLKGSTYCCDCGTSTMSHAIMCVQCGASFQRKFPAALAVLILSILIVAATITGYVISEENDHPAESFSELKPKPANPLINNKQNKPKGNSEATTTITNKIIVKDPTYANAIDKLAKNAAKQNVSIPNATAIIKKEKEKTEEVKDSKPMSEKININGFSRSQINRYPVTCSYFIGKSRNNIIFFTTTVFGYLRINGKLYELQGVEKGNDIARFSNSFYDVTIEILGLSGSETEWLASGKLVIMDKQKRILSIHNINSTCTDF